MSTPRTAGRPKAISREMLQEAACELFLEQGYEATSVADITRRAGVSRATFFNYVDSKSDLLWASVDDVIAQVESVLAQGISASAPLGQRTPEWPGVDQMRGALLEAAAGMQAGVAVLAIANAEAMGVREELVFTGAGRQARLAQVLSESLQAQGAEVLEAEVLARAHAGAFFAALESWARTEPGTQPFESEVERGLSFL